MSGEITSSKKANIYKYLVPDPFTRDSNVAEKTYNFDITIDIAVGTPQTNALCQTSRFQSLFEIQIPNIFTLGCINQLMLEFESLKAIS